LAACLLAGASATGINFWSAMYIPIVVAMAASQNVVAAVDGGMLALLAGLGAVVISFALVPVLSRFGPQSEPLPPSNASNPRKQEES
jgi:malonate transporter MadL subunit